MNSKTTPRRPRVVSTSQDQYVGVKAATKKKNALSPKFVTKPCPCPRKSCRWAALRMRQKMSKTCPFEPLAVCLVNKTRNKRISALPLSVINLPRNISKRAKSRPRSQSLMILAKNKGKRWPTSSSKECKNNP